MRKPVFWVFNQVRHKPGCTTTEDGERLELWDVESRGICSKNKGIDQLRGDHTADLHFVFANAKSRFSHDMAPMSKRPVSSKHYDINFALHMILKIPMTKAV